MNTIDYFKLQAKNLYRDFKTQKPVFDEEFKNYVYEYTPKYFDILGIILDLDFDEEKFSLMNAQHIIAELAGFYKWGELLKATEEELELSKLLFDNQHIIDVINWKIYIANVEEMNGAKLDSEEKLDVYKQVFLEMRLFEDSTTDYLLREGKSNVY
jgi:hypothetical protein